MYLGIEKLSFFSTYFRSYCYLSVSATTHTHDFLVNLILVTYNNIEVTRRVVYKCPQIPCNPHFHLKKQRFTIKRKIAVSFLQGINL